MTQVPGKIYLADQRGLVENSQFRRHSTFNFEAFQHEHKGPFGHLYGLNEETLAGGHEVAFNVGFDSYIV
ncbi:MAG: pirin, partial [Hymenobacter sp.]